MADNVAITAGSGTTIATDDIGSGVQVQRVKPVWGADGVGNDTSDTTPLPVSVRQPQTWFEIDVPGVAATSHTLGDQFGTLITITNAARVSGGTGWINSVLVHDDADTSGAFDIVFFNDTPTLAADDAAYAVSDADNRKTLWVANVTYVTDMGANRFGQQAGISVPYFCTGTSLFVAVITRTTFTATAAAVRLRFALTRD